MVQPFQQFRTMLGIVNIIDFVVAVLEPLVHILMTRLDQLIGSLSQGEFVLPNVLRHMGDDDVGFVYVGDLEHLMKYGHVDCEFLDNQEDIHLQLFTTASFLELLQALESVTEGQQFFGQNLSEGGQVSQDLVDGIALKLGFALITCLLQMEALLKVLQTWES